MKRTKNVIYVKNCVIFLALSFCDTPLIQVTTSDAMHLVTIMSVRDLINVILSWQSLNSETSRLERICHFSRASFRIYLILLQTLKS